mmetsp:Transcript_12882/g.35655  ORF Transcript_12882/g.35655 Transcript_12882/m.35655 type:complete len:331 (+) Transcript_12882:74-1066(+)
MTRLKVGFAGGVVGLLAGSLLLNAVLLSHRMTEQTASFSSRNDLAFTSLLNQHPRTPRPTPTGTTVVEKSKDTLQQQQLSADRENCTLTATIPSNLFVPIFILTRDRIQALKETLESYERTLATPHEIIVLDHSSTYPPMLEFLRRLQDEQHMKVHTLPEPVWDDALAHADRIMQDYLRQHTNVEYYVLTDPDVALQRSNADILLFFAGLLASCPDVNVVGPHLQISDLPPHYTGKYNNYTVYEWESQFWKTVPYMATWKGIGYHFAEQLIDTTFAMRRRTQKFARITCPCLRTYAPYAAVHLDWYLDLDHLPADKKYYLNKSFGGVNNW